jgi:hypothetical protein
VPGIVVSYDVLYGNPCIGQFRQTILESDEPFGDDVAVFDVVFEHVAHEKQGIQALTGSSETIDQVALVDAILRRRGASEVRIGYKDSQTVVRQKAVELAKIPKPAPDLSVLWSATGAPASSFPTIDVQQSV